VTHLSQCRDRPYGGSNPPPLPSPLVHFIRRSCDAVGGARQLGVLSVRFIARRLNDRIRNCTWAVERIR
jgi:hypothetical protein